jgi:hypothetical protein
MFLLLVRRCGIFEAKFWAESLGLKHEKSYALLSELLYGKQFFHAPNVIG